VVVDSTGISSTSEVMATCTKYERTLSIKLDIPAAIELPGGNMNSIGHRSHLNNGTICKHQVSNFIVQSPCANIIHVFTIS